MQKKGLIVCRFISPLTTHERATVIFYNVKGETVIQYFRQKSVSITQATILIRTILLIAQVFIYWKL